MATMSHIVNEPVSAVFIEDPQFPVAAFLSQPKCYVTRLLKGHNLSLLTLLNVTIPWSNFVGLPSLTWLDVESVEVSELGNDYQQSQRNHRSALTPLRWRNCTSKLIQYPDAHGLNFGHLVNLHCDVGSIQSSVYTWTLIRQNQKTLLTLAMELEGNDDPPDAETFGELNFW